MAEGSAHQGADGTTHMPGNSSAGHPGARPLNPGDLDHEVDAEHHATTGWPGQMPNYGGAFTPKAGPRLGLGLAVAGVAQSWSPRAPPTWSWAPDGNEPEHTQKNRRRRPTGCQRILGPMWAQPCGPVH